MNHLGRIPCRRMIQVVQQLLAFYVLQRYCFLTKRKLLLQTLNPWRASTFRLKIYDVSNEIGKLYHFQRQKKASNRSRLQTLKAFVSCFFLLCSIWSSFLFSNQRIFDGEWRFTSTLTPVADGKLLLLLSADRYTPVANDVRDATTLTRPPFIIAVTVCAEW